MQELLVKLASLDKQDFLENLYVLIIRSKCI